MNFFISVIAVGLLIALHEAGHFAAARRVGMKVKRYSIGLLRSVVSWTSKKTGIVYQIGILPLGGFVEIKGMNPFEEDAFKAPDSYQNKAAWRRGIVLVAGPLANLVTAWVLFFGLSLAGLPAYVDEPAIGLVVKGGPADQSGIQVDDRVLTFNGESLENWSDLATRLHKHPGEEVALEIEREGGSQIIRVTPKDVNGTGRIGIYQPTKYVTSPPHTAALIASLKIYQIVTDTFSALALKMSGAGQEMQAVGPVGIIKMAATALDSGLRQFLGLVAYLSVMLFIFNLLPIPALDGGRGVFLLYEVVTRKRVRPKVEAMVNTVGFFLLIGLILVMSAGELFGE